MYLTRYRRDKAVCSIDMKPPTGGLSFTLKNSYNRLGVRFFPFSETPINPPRAEELLRVTHSFTLILSNVVDKPVHRPSYPR